VSCTVCFAPAAAEAGREVQQRPACRGVWVKVSLYHNDLVSSVMVRPAAAAAVVETWHRCAMKMCLQR
jgi:hypothetical protein